MTRLAAVACLAALAPLSSPAAEPKAARGTLPLPVALEDLPAATRDSLTKVMKDPTLKALGPAEEFVAHADVYQWLLDHPDRTAAAWRNLGVDAVEIKALKDGKFAWKDESGSELVWRSVAQGPTGRVWYAEGHVKPGVLLPTVPVKAVAVLNHTEKARATGDAVIRHQVEVYLHTDSKAAALVTRALGDSAPKMAEQGSEQLLAFFSGIARYAHDKPEKARALFATDKGR